MDGLLRCAGLLQQVAGPWRQSKPRSLADCCTAVALKIETERNSSPGSDGPQMGVFDEEERGLERPSYEWVRKKNCEGAIR